MLKRLGIIIFLLLLTTPVVIAQVDINFPDVTLDDWFVEEVEYVENNRLMTGYENGNFGPNDPMTRAQLAAVLTRMEAGAIDEILIELRALRFNDSTTLTGSSFEEYLDARLRFPVTGISGAGEGAVDYETVQDNLMTVTTTPDGTYSILATSETGTFFFIEENSELRGKVVYGSFYDDVARIAAEAETS